MSRVRPPSPGRAFFWRATAGAAAVVLCAAVSVAALALGEVQRVTEIVRQQAEPLQLEGVVTDSEAGAPQTLLLVGSDRRYQGQQLLDARSDTMLLVRLDPQAPSINVLSVPRDLPHQRRLRDGRIITDKINGTYTRGGAAATVRALQELLDTEIHHVVDVDFRGFRALVNGIGCVWVDVDRRYFNRNQGTADTNYAEINLKPGYQKLCGQDSLDYVRHRYSDSDFQRAERQQEFLRAAKSGIVASRLIQQRERLIALVAAQTRTDVMDSHEILELAKLAAFCAGKPVQHIRFPARLGGPFDPYVHAEQAKIQRAVRRFMNLDQPAAKPPTARPRNRRQPSSRAGGMESARVPSRQEARGLGAVGIPVLAPTRRRANTTYVDPPRRYVIEDQQGFEHAAYRLVLAGRDVGQFYGIQGTAWRNPPLLEKPQARRRIKGRVFELFYDGRKLRRVALRTSRGVYWVSNTLSLELSNQQMLAIAASLKEMGRR